jgi:hypothetical protein
MLGRMVANSAGRRQTSRVVVGALLWGALTFAATWLILRVVDDELTSNPEAAAPQLRILIWLVVGGGSVLALSRSQLAALTGWRSRGRDLCRGDGDGQHTPYARGGQREYVDILVHD